MPRSEREDILSALTSRIFAALLGDIVMDAALQAHHEVSRSRAICTLCNTCCNSAHTPGPANLGSQSAALASNPGTPSSADAKAASGSSGTGTPTSVKADGNLYLECVNCSRQIASNRYAPHLSSCMGLSSARRGTARGAVKSKQPSEAGRSASPASEVGNGSDDGRPLKGKARSKTKRVDDAEFNLKRKRPVSPQVSPQKKQKKQKTSASAVTRVKTDPDAGLPNNAHYSPSTGSKSKVPSKLRDSSTASYIERSSPSGSSRSSSPDEASVATQGSSYSARSPSIATKGIPHIKGKALGTGPPKRPSPPRPPLLPFHAQDYTIDVEGGDETGSSTDTDSS